MQCVRCQGLMIVDRFVDMDQSGNAQFVGWRCLVCGNITDPVMAANRRNPPVLKRALPTQKFAA